MSKKPDLSGYDYGAISSLILTTNCPPLPRRDKESIDAPVSLSPNTDPKDIGAVEGTEDSKYAPKRKNTNAGYNYANIEAIQDIEGLIYLPRTAEARQVYELIFSAIRTSLGDKSQGTVSSSTDTVLKILKEGVNHFDKKKGIEEVIGHISNEQFSQLVDLSNKLTDYSTEGKSTSAKFEMKKDIVFPHSIDAFWVQRQLAEIYPDPVTTADMASTVVNILVSDSSTRDCENRLANLFEYQNLHVITKLLQNREATVWCTKSLNDNQGPSKNNE